MDKVEILLEKAYKNNKKILLEEILKFELTEEEYNIIMDVFQKNGVSVENSIAEKQLNKKLYKVTDDVELYFDEISKIPLLTVEEERDLFKIYNETKDLEIRQKLINSNLRLVVSVVKCYVNRNIKNVVDFLDLIQDGNEGLAKAVEKFDITLGYKFSTYAVWWIRENIELGLNNFSRTIRIPIYLMADYKKIKKYKDTQKKVTTNIPRYSEIAKALGMTESYVKYICDAVEKEYVSIYQPVGEESGSVLLDFIPSDEDLIEDVILQKIVNQDLNKILKRVLTQREYYVITYRYGLINEINDSVGRLTLPQIGSQLGITSEGVRKIESKALRKLKIKMRNDQSKFL